MASNWACTRHTGPERGSSRVTGEAQLFPAGRTVAEAAVRVRRHTRQPPPRSMAHQDHEQGEVIS